MAHLRATRLGLLLFVCACAPQDDPAGPTGDAMWFEGARLIVGDGSGPIMNAAFLVEEGAFAWVGRVGEAEPSKGATRVDLAGKTVIPGLIDGHNHIGLTNVKDGTDTKENYTRENLIDQLQRS